MSTEPLSAKPATAAGRRPHKRVKPPALEVAGEKAADDLGHIVGVVLDADLRRIRDRAACWEPRAPR